MKTRTLFLKLSLALVAVIVLFFNVLLFPHFRAHSVEDYFFIGALYVSALIFYYLVFQAFKILLLVDRNLAFSGKCLNAVRQIKLAACGIGITYLALMPEIYAMAQEEDAPGLILMGGTVILLPFIISTFVAVLQRLFQNAIELKQENDFTV